MKSQCKTCGRNCEGEYCFKHKPRKPLPVGNALVKMYQKRKEDDEMRSLFLWIWRKRIHFSEISSKKLGAVPLSVFFHHILPKEKYHCTVDLLFGWFGFSSFVTMKLSSHLLVWMNPNRHYKGTIAMTTILGRHFWQQ